VFELLALLVVLFGEGFDSPLEPFVSLLGFIALTAVQDSLTGDRP
jgi:hypothetical protein